MALVLIEGLDRTGKSTVASYFKEHHNYEIIHLSAPPKDMSSEQYFQELVEIISLAATKDIVMDRTHYGELIWPIIFNRRPLLSKEDIASLREIEESVGVRRILMHDNNVHAHWQRCVDNNEPLNKIQFTKARSLYYQLAKQYGFEVFTLDQFLGASPDKSGSADSVSNTDLGVSKIETRSVDSVSAPTNKNNTKHTQTKTPQQLKLEKANAINDILSRNILKIKGPIYEELEQEIRAFLNDKLSHILGGSSSNQELTLTPEEVKFYKIMYKRAIEKGDT